MQFVFKSADIDYSAIKAIAVDDKYEAISISPNPAKETITIHYSGLHAIKNITFYDPGGQKILSQRPDNNQINTSSLKAGLYLLELQTEDQFIYKKCIITN